MPTTRPALKKGMVWKIRAIIGNLIIGLPIGLQVMVADRLPAAINPVSME